MVFRIKVSADTVCGIVLSDVSEVFTHPFTQCSFGVPNVLFVTHLTSNTIYDVIGLTATTPDSVVFATSDGAYD